MLIDWRVSHSTFQCVWDLEGLWKAFEDIDTGLGTELGNGTDNTADQAQGWLWPLLQWVVCDPEYVEITTTAKATWHTGRPDSAKRNTLVWWCKDIRIASKLCMAPQGKCTGHANQTMWHCQMVQTVCAVTATGSTAACATSVSLHAVALPVYQTAYCKSKYADELLHENVRN